MFEKQAIILYKMQNNMGKMNFSWLFCFAFDFKQITNFKFTKAKEIKQAGGQLVKQHFLVVHRILGKYIHTYNDKYKHGLFFVVGL